MGEPGILELEAARIDDLAAIRAFVHARASALGASAGEADDLVIALDEAATNTLRHGYAGRPGPLRIECLRAGSALVVHLIDEAPPFDPTGRPEPDLEIALDRRPFGGMGIHLMRTSVDRLTYRRIEPSRNDLTFIKELSPLERRTAR